MAHIQCTLEQKFQGFRTVSVPAAARSGVKVRVLPGVRPHQVSFEESLEQCKNWTQPVLAAKVGSAYCMTNQIIVIIIIIHTFISTLWSCALLQRSQAIR